MRLVAAPSGGVDRTDRALWLSLGFDLAWAGAPVPAGALVLSAAPIGGNLGFRGAPAAGPGLGRLGRELAAGAAAGTLGRELAGSAAAGTPGRELAGPPAGGGW